ncbi:hypothetical protein [Nonomuraea glycinis]|uniref:hypothetical protein n=1 Tax=Nonomuraea glycinis TaxID=2047744 RepID=UPI0033A42EBF
MVKHDYLGYRVGMVLSTSGSVESGLSVTKDLRDDDSSQASAVRAAARRDCTATATRSICRTSGSRRRTYGAPSELTVTPLELVFACTWQRSRRCLTQHREINQP